MSGRDPTPEQRAAIGASDGEIMVEAGAGTGKTGVMVDRYCRLVCDERLDPGEILAFTFTDKAAAELRGRIRAAIEERAEGGDERARELLPGLGGAWITTIHGFCNRLLLAHPVAVGIDPRFRVLDAPEAERASAEAFEEALEDLLSGGDPDCERTVAAFDVGGLRRIVTVAHAELRSRGVAEPRLPEPPEPDVEGAVRRAATVAAETAGELRPGSANRELVERALAVLEGEHAASSLEQVAALRTTSRAETMGAYREAIEEVAARVAEAGEGGLAYRHLAELLRIFSQRFAAAKDRRAGVDFEDLQILAARLLERTEAGAAYGARFTHLLVDEFQDTNRLQLRLIESLRGPRTELMVVGDELQSIYGFRHADLDVFRERRARIEAGGSRGRLIPLSGNFRSRPEVIGAVNAFGERMLGEDYRPLRVGASPERPEPAGGGPAVEVLLTGRDGWDAEGLDLAPATDARTPLNQLAEARFLATRLRELADAGVERGAMVVLLRAFTRLDAHEDALERAGLRPYVVGGRGYWSQQQVADVCALLATIANPLDDQALLGALSSPACGVAPDTLWLLRAAAGRGRHLWPAVARAGGVGEGPEVDTEWLERIPDAEVELLRRFAEVLGELRRRAASESLPSLIDAAVAGTGYDLAILMRPSGEARFANVRKLMRLAAEYESAEGRDLRGLIEFLAARADADADAQAATAVEGHDGVRIMTIHSAKGLEFDVVAIPHLSRRLLPAAGDPALLLGRDPATPSIGLQLKRLGARVINLYDHRELSEDAKRRESREELRLFHVGATRARERLLLSGVIAPTPPSQPGHGTSVIERLAAAFEIDREHGSTLSVPAPEPRPGLETTFASTEIAVSVSLASAERAAALTAVRREPEPLPDDGRGPAPLVAPRPARDPGGPLSYTALDSAHDEGRDRLLSSHAEQNAISAAVGGDREVARARGIAIHALLEWSQANGWREPDGRLVERVAVSAEVGTETALDPNALLTPLRAWLGSNLFADRVRGARSRAEVPLLVEVAGAVLRGSIDLLVESEGPPLVVDYKTDRIGEARIADLATRYEIQQAVYGLAVAEARGTERVELAYVFLERPEEPFIASWGRPELDAGRELLEREIARARRG
jgi:ATP-dependent helicase/nuclease subunit A